MKVVSHRITWVFLAAACFAVFTFTVVTRVDMGAVWPFSNWSTDRLISAVSKESGRFRPLISNGFQLLPSFAVRTLKLRHPRPWDKDRVIAISELGYRTEELQNHL